MKEFGAQEGGRYTYADDLLNLQELALAFSSIFNDCDNFIVSGCEVSGTSISAGYIYLNGKLRYFSGATGVSSWPRYLYEQNSIENVAYASGADKVGRYIYGCALATSVPTALDPITKAVPTAIRLTADGGLRMREALFGKYALLLQTTNASQTVAGTVNFGGDVTVGGAMSVNGGVAVKRGSGTAQIDYDGNDFIIKSRISGGTTYEMRIANETGFEFFVGGVKVGSFTSDGFVTEKSVSAGSGLFGNIGISEDHVYNSTTGNNLAALNINMLGYNGGNSYFRNTHIGNGKGTAILSIVGSTSSVSINGTLSIYTSSLNSLTLKSTLLKSNIALRNIIQWTDYNNAVMASVGFNSTTDSVFEIKNAIADIDIVGQTAVNIGPAIKENGTLLTDKYLTRADYQTSNALKADLSAVYTKTDADTVFAKKASGLSQFVVGSTTQANLRQQIGALGASDVSGVYARIDQLLADVATTDAKKQTIRNNIGAAGVDDFQAKLKDTGWIQIEATGQGWTQGKLYARQIGNIVCIQGKTNTRHQNTLFQLPNQIESPRYDVTFRSPNTTWGGSIEGGSRVFNVLYCSQHDKIIPFSLTYMV